MIDRAERIHKAITEKGLSYAELEKLTGVSKSALQRYATGETKKIPVDVIEKIAAAAGVTSRYLMGWDEEKENASHLHVRSMKEDEVIKALTENGWIEYLSNLSPENRTRLKDIAEAFLSAQAQADLGEK